MPDPAVLYTFIYEPEAITGDKTPEGISGLGFYLKVLFPVKAEGEEINVLL